MTDKTAYYSAAGISWAQLSGRKDFISGISHKENTVTIRGALMKAPSFGKKSTLLKNKARTFKMAKQCRYNYIDGRCTKDLSKKKFFQTANNNPRFFGFYTYTNSKGEIYQMVVDYSM